MQNSLAEIGRVRRRQFTESDIKAILVGIRGKCGPILQEIGDLIAHHERNRGAVHGHILESHARVSMLTKYQLEPKSTFPTDGSCDWWLRAFLLGQVKHYPKKETKQALNVIPLQLSREIQKYFPSGLFPTKLLKLDRRFFDILEFLSTKLVSYPIYKQSDALDEIRDLLKKVNADVDQELSTDVLVCLAILLHKSQYVLPYDGVGTCELTVDQRPPAISERGGTQSAQATPHGALKVTSQSGVKVNGKEIKFAFPLLDTEIQTDDYVDPILIESNEKAVPFISLDVPLQFDRKLRFPIAPA